MDSVIIHTQIDGKEFEQSYQGHMDNFIDLDNDQLQQALRDSLAYNQLQTSLPHQGMFATKMFCITCLQ